MIQWEIYQFRLKKLKARSCLVDWWRFLVSEEIVTPSFEAFRNFQYLGLESIYSLRGILLFMANNKSTLIKLPLSFNFFVGGDGIIIKINLGARNCLD